MIRSMAFSQKYTLVSPIEPITTGDTFNSHEWPLHVTIADTFAIEAIDGIMEESLNRAKAQHAFKVSGEKTTYFGSDKSVEVLLLRTSDQLYQLHSEVVDVLLTHGATFNDPQYTKDGFIGHITQQKDNRINVDQEVLLDSIALIDMFPGGDPYERKVLKIIHFGEV